MRRMKDMGSVGGGGEMSFYGNLPDSYNLVVNANHPLVAKIMNDKDEKVGAKVKEINEKIKPVQEEKAALDKAQEKKKEEEIPQADKDKVSDLETKLRDLENEKTEVLKNYGNENKLIKQMIDLALLSNNMLRGEDLTKFVKRSVELIKE